MLVVISPSKNLNEKPDRVISKFTLPDFLEESAILISKLRSYSPEKLSKLMNINRKLSELNVNRYHAWSLPFTAENSLPSLLMFSGEVYNGLKARTLNEKELNYAQDHLRILSGLYGVLRPLDLIKPYRLEMGTELRIGKLVNLYNFWGDKITDTINRELKNQKQKVLVNLASDEYFKALRADKIEGRIVSCMFKELVGDRYKFITIYGKKARGLMTRFIIQNRIGKVEDLKHFEEEGYFYNDRLSKEDYLVFTR